MSDTPDSRTQRALVEHQLPEGLLPTGLVQAHIETDGRFSVVLPKRVERTHGGYRVRFGPRISGRVTAGRVEKLQGVEAKQMLWFPVQAITADGDELVFTVGPAQRRLPRSAFS